MPRPLRDIASGTASDELLTDALVYVRAAEPAGSVPPSVIRSLVDGRRPSLHALAFSELYRRSQRPALPAMREQLRLAGTSETNPEVIGRRIAFEARYGDLVEARRLALAMVDLQTRGNGGTNIRTAHRALDALAQREVGDAAQMFGIAARLVRLDGKDAEPLADDA